MFIEEVIEVVKWLPSSGCASTAAGELMYSVIEPSHRSQYSGGAGAVVIAHFRNSNAKARACRRSNLDPGGDNENPQLLLPKESISKEFL